MIGGHSAGEQGSDEPTAARCGDTKTECGDAEPEILGQQRNQRVVEKHREKRHGREDERHQQQAATRKLGYAGQQFRAEVGGLARGLGRQGDAEHQGCSNQRQYGIEAKHHLHRPDGQQEPAERGTRNLGCLVDGLM
ncbi:hypothetical protein FQZ97_1092650 [compost metagenome]